MEPSLVAGVTSLPSLLAASRLWVKSGYDITDAKRTSMLATSGPARCSPPFLPSGGRCLWLTGGRGSREAGTSECARLGGQLAAMGRRDGALLTKLLQTVPHQRHVWISASGRWRRDDRLRQLGGMRLCRAVQADTGWPVLRNCSEKLPSLCERTPLTYSDNKRQGRRRRSGLAEETLEASDPLQWGQSCHCDEGYGDQTCEKVNGNSGHEQYICDGARIGDDPKKVIIVDFGYLGRMPFDNAASHIPSCYDPVVPLPAGDPGCMAPNSQAILRYWCQGKNECMPLVHLIASFTPDSCVANVTSVLRVRTREVAPDQVQSCTLGSTFFGGTCYLVTLAAGRWDDQLQRCRQMGGDLAFVPNTGTAAFLSFVSQLAGGQPLWVAGQADEARPVVDLRPSWYIRNQFTCVDRGTVTKCDRNSLSALCAMPPWTKGDLPTPSQCPQRRYKNWAFPATDAGTTALVPCDQGGDFRPGNASWFCRLNATWATEFPDLTDCTSPGVDTKDAKRRLENGTEPVADVVFDLATNYSRSATISSGDLVNTIQLMPTMVLQQHKQLNKAADGKGVAQVYMHNITLLVSLVTEVHRGHSWLTMPHGTKRYTSSTLQNTLEQSAGLVAQYLHNQIANFNQHNQQISVRTGRYTGGSVPAAALQYRGTSGSSIQISQQAVPQSENTTIVYAEYTTLGCLLGERGCSSFGDNDRGYQEVVDSTLFTASLGNGSYALSLHNSTVTIRLKRRLANTVLPGFRRKDYVTNNQQCVYWVQDDLSTRQFWSSEGCVLVHRDEELVTCQCNHLTSFATLVDFQSASQGVEAALAWITYLGGALSIICLALCVVVFSAVPALRSDRSSVHRNLCLSLLIAEIFLLAGLERRQNESDGACIVIAVILHFFLLAAFGWMSIEGAQIYLLLYKVFDSGRPMMRYFYAVGYGIPTVIVVVSLAAAHTGYGTPTSCWLSDEKGVVWAFEGPVLLVILSNTVVLALALRVTHHARAARSDKSKQLTASWIKGTASLVVILGTTWIFGFFQFNGAEALTDFIVVVFTVLNSLQGVFIFLFHVVFNDKTRRESIRHFWKTTGRLGWTSEKPSRLGLSSSAGRTTNTVLTRTNANAPKANNTSTSNANANAASNGDANYNNGDTSDTNWTQRKQPNALMRLFKRARINYSVKRVQGEMMASPIIHQQVSRIESLPNPAPTAADAQAGPTAADAQTKPTDHL